MMNGNILGIGNDIVEIERIREGVEKHGDRFLSRLFTDEEQKYCRKYKDPFPHFAARFSAKEAIVKALGTGFGESAAWHDIEIFNDPLGKPHVRFSEKANLRFQNPVILISMSHCVLYATAVALWIKN